MVCWFFLSNSSSRLTQHVYLSPQVSVSETAKEGPDMSDSMKNPVLMPTDKLLLLVYGSKVQHIFLHKDEAIFSDRHRQIHHPGGFSLKEHITAYVTRTSPCAPGKGEDIAG